MFYCFRVDRLTGREKRKLLVMGGKKSLVKPWCFKNVNNLPVDYTANYSLHIHYK